MTKRLITFKSSRWFKWVFLLTSWVFSILILIVVTNNNELSTLYNESVIYEPELRLHKNQVGSFKYVRQGPRENGGPMYSVYFKNLQAENNKLGIFKTGLNKLVKIQDLQLKIYRYTTHNINPTTSIAGSKSPKITVDNSSYPFTTVRPSSPPIVEDITAEARALIEDVMHKFKDPKDRWRVDIDLSNVSQFRIRNFDYRVFYGDDLFFSIQGKRVIGSPKHSVVILRGHVVLTAAGGSTLESNYIKWDIENQCFIASGGYLLRRYGVSKTGDNICVDAQLNDIKSIQAESKRKEKKDVS